MSFSFGRYAVVLVAVLCTLGLVQVVLAASPSGDFDISDTVPEIGESVNFTATGLSDLDGGTPTVSWTFGDGGTANGSPTSHPYTSAGDKTVTMTIADPQGSDPSTIVTKTLHVNAPPSASFTISPNPANAGSNVTFDASASNDPEGAITAANHEWDLDGDGQYDDATGTTTSRSYPSGGAKTIGLRVTDSDGATDTATQTLTVNNAAPTASFTISPNPANPGEPVTFDGTGSSDPEGPITAANHEWDLDGDGQYDDATGTTTSRSYPSGGAKTIGLRVTDSDGATDTETKTLTVNNTAPTAAFTISPNPADAGQTVTFNGSSSSDPEGPITAANHEWDLDGDGQYDDATGTTTSRSYPSGGAKTIGLRVTDSDGATDTETKTLTVNNTAPTAAFTISPNPADAGQTVTFNGSSSSDPEGPITAANHEWDLDGNGSFEITGNTVSRSYPTGGDRQITLRVTDSDGATDTETKTLTVNNTAPTAAFTISPNPADAGQTVTFNGSSSSDPEGPITAANHEWDLDGDGQYDDATGTTTSRSYPSGGAKTIGLRVSDSEGVVDTDTRTLNVNNAAPTASFTISPNPAGAGATVTFDGSGSTDPEGPITAANHDWDLDGNGSFETTGTTVSRSYLTGGPRQITLQVTDSNGVTDTQTQTLNVTGGAPTASFTISPNPANPGEPVTFDGTGSSDPEGPITAANHEWDLDGDGQYDDATGTTTSRSYPSGGAKTIGLRVTDSDGATDTETKTLTVNNTAPTAAFTISPNPADAGQTVTFNGSSSSDPEGAIAAANHQWDLDGDGQYDDATGTTTSRSYPSGGAKTIGLRVTDSDGATDTATQTLTVNNAAPTAAFTISPNPADAGQTVTFNGSSSSDPEGAITAANHQWDLDGDGQYDDATGTTTSRSYPSGGAKTIGLRVTDSDGAAVTDTATQTLTVRNAPPNANVTYEVVPAELQNAGQNPQVPLVGQQVTFRGGTSSDPEGSIAPGDHAWDLDGDGTFETTGTTVTSTFPAGAAADRLVQLRVTDAEGATNVEQVLVRVNRAPTADFVNSPTTPVINEEITFASVSTDPDPATLANPANGSLTNYQWDLDNDNLFGETGSPTQVEERGPSAKQTFATAGNKTVRLRVTDGGGAQHTTTRTIRVEATRPNAALEFSPPAPLPNQPVTFNSRSTPSNAPSNPTIETVQWDFDYDGRTFQADATGPTVSRSFATAGPKRVAIRATETGGGFDEQAVTVVVNAPPQASFNVAPGAPLDGDNVTLASTSSDPDGPLGAQQWDLDGDGQYDDASGPVASRALATGPHTLRLRVTDASGATATAERRIDVLERPLKLLTGVKVTLFGNLTARGVKLKRLLVRTPGKANVKVTCKGKKCPKGARAASTRPLKTKRVRFKKFERAFPAGTLITVTVTRPGYIGQHTTIKIRKGLRRYIRRDGCLRPGSSKPIACPDS